MMDVIVTRANYMMPLLKPVCHFCEYLHIYIFTTVDRDPWFLKDVSLPSKSRKGNIFFFYFLLFMHDVHLINIIPYAKFF